MSRLRDLIATADRQLAAQSYDAAIDTCRTALTVTADEDTAAERSDIESRLQQANLARDRARGPQALLREARAHADAGRTEEAAAMARRVLTIDPGNAEASSLCPSPSAPVSEPGVELEPVLQVAAPEPERQPPATIEPPSFDLLEPDLSSRHRMEPVPDEPPLSILQPASIPEPPDRTPMMMIWGTLIFVFFLGVVLTSRHPRVPRTELPATVMHAQSASDPIVISRVDPEYPESERTAGVTGTVDMIVEVRPDGRAIPQSILGGVDAELNRAAVEAVRQWRFQPSLLNGAAVVSMTRVQIKFPPE